MTQSKPSRVVLIVLDSVGIGETPDAHLYGDEGSNTLSNTAKAVGGLHLPNMAGLGLPLIPGVSGVGPVVVPARGAFGRMAPASPGKDTVGGHWEMMGVVLEKPFRTYPHGFPRDVIAEFERRTGRRTLGNVAASGTEIIERLGKEHVATGDPIVYTSADSVFQIAAHEDVIPVDELYGMCLTARSMLVGENLVGRVIARPFAGEPGAFKRTERRRDFPLEPPESIVLGSLVAAGVTVTAIGKIEDIFCGKGISRSFHTGCNADSCRTLEDLVLGERAPDAAPELLFANLVDFDMVYGHRNDPHGYARALEQFDESLGRMLPGLRPSDLLVVTADHGCDPTTPSTDHSREYVPVLLARPRVLAGADIGLRRTFADLGATLAEAFGVKPPHSGESFLSTVYSL
ncbi:MAG: phosphopentomutase [Firmicutes bacterium]|nr:phosphopentomutase [Bacillota bacterium]